MARLIMTVEQMKDRALWLKKRRNGLGGSDAAVIMGLNPWKSPYALWAEKTGTIPEPDLADNQRVYWGQRNEAAVAEWFSEQTGKAIRRKGMVQSCEHPWMLATLDREITGEDAGLEVKTAGVDQAKAWADGNVPEMYRIQCQWYMAVTGFDHWYIAVLIGGNDARWSVIERDQALIDNLIEKGKAFWDMVQSKTPPPLDGEETTTEALKQKYKGGKTDAILLQDDAVIAAYDNLKRYDDEEKELKKKKEACKQAIMDAMGDHEIADIAGHKVTWKFQAGKTTIDTKAFKKDQPALFAQYAKTGAPIRVFKAS